MKNAASVLIGMMTNTYSYSKLANDDAEQEDGSEAINIIASGYSPDSEPFALAQTSKDLDLPDWIRFWPV